MIARVLAVAEDEIAIERMHQFGAHRRLHAMGEYVHRVRRRHPFVLVIVAMRHRRLLSVIMPRQGREPLAMLLLVRARWMTIGCWLQ